ncbi:MAG TPA: hypothetical protein VK869_04225 [Rubrobacteraceae bacterium]|jgi:hypothetical protein|nr:hypothetical protein [Rubrobacteraceae bacterium]
MTATKERVRGHYEVVEAPYAKDYVWVPGTEAAATPTGWPLYPWRVEYDRWLDENAAHPEEQEWTELRALV